MKKVLFLCCLLISAGACVPKNQAVVTKSEPVDPGIPPPPPPSSTVVSPTEVPKEPAPTPVGSVDTTDPLGDIHYWEGGDYNTRCAAPEPKEDAIDISRSSASRQGDVLEFSVCVGPGVKSNPGYREYQVWIDVDPEAQRGYIPYCENQRYVHGPVAYQACMAWKNFFADYRLFYSVDNNGGHSEKVMVQKCGLAEDHADNCGADDALYMSQKDLIDGTPKVESSASCSQRVVFRVRASTLGVTAAQAIHVGFTAHYSLSRSGKKVCHGEDDAPQWGANPFSF